MRRHWRWRHERHAQALRHERQDVCVLLCLLLERRPESVTRLGLYLKQDRPWSGLRLL